MYARPPVTAERPWVLLCKPVRAPFRDGTSVLVRNLVQALPAEHRRIYFGDPSAPLRPDDRVLSAAAMAYQPTLTDKARMFAALLGPRLAGLPVHSFFAANRSSAAALVVARRVPLRRVVLQTLPASTGAETIAGALRRVDHVVVPSDWGRERLIEAGLPAARVSRIYPGVPAPTDLPEQPQRESVLFAGDLDEAVAGHLVRVARALERTPWRLDIATRPKGEGHQKALAWLEAELASALAAGRVRLLGEVSSMAELFDAAAIQLYLADHARRKVDLPFALLEGMARGVPAAILDAPPVSELLACAAQEGLEVGVPLDPQSDPGEALRAVVDDPARLEAMGVAARELIRRRFSAEIMAAAYLERYAALS